MTALVDTDLTECQTSKNLEVGKRSLSPIPRRFTSSVEKKVWLSETLSEVQAAERMRAHQYGGFRSAVCEMRLSYSPYN
jgi:hypothetical protein